MPKNENTTGGQNTEAERIERWRWMLEQNMPIIGGWMHRRITSALVESAVSGNWLAAQSLAVVFVSHNEADVRKMAGQTLRKINYSTGIDAVWGVWAETRSPGLEQIALEYNRAAAQPASVRLLSTLRLSLQREDLLNTLAYSSAELVQPLIQACEDRDPQIAGQARRVIATLHNPASIDAVCRAWQTSRSPFLTGIIQQAGYVAQRPADTRVLSALKVNQLDAVMHSSADMVVPLVAACQDEDEEIAVRGRQCLPHLQSQAAVDEFCRLWSETRSPLLEEALLQASYKARSPVQVRLLSALKTGYMPAAEKVIPQGLPFLLKATRDADPTIQKNARAALANLKDEETRDALCSLVIEQGPAPAAANQTPGTKAPRNGSSGSPAAAAITAAAASAAAAAGLSVAKSGEVKAAAQPLSALEPEDITLAREVALANHYVPRSPELRALFFFLTDQWQLYDELDFDQGMMRAIYEASPAELRQRIAARVQAAGRTDYLTILAGVDYRARAEEVSPSEARLMVHILAGNKEYERLWSLVPELALPFSLEIIHILEKAAWRPGSEADQPIFDELIQLSHLPIQLTGPELARILPLAIPRATLKVKGRVNEVAFSPDRPVLAIATSQRKVVQWNFQAAAVERVHNIFIHSVGKVSYTPRGTLLCAERTNNQALCSVFVYGEQETYQLTAHEGTVTVLEPVGDNLLLTAGRDSHAFLWDLDRKKKVAEKEYPFWARSAAISPDRQYAALLHDRLSLVRLPELTIVPGYPFLTPRAEGFKHGVAQNAAFSPDGKFLLSGQYNGQVGLYYHTSLTQRPRKGMVTQHSQPVRGIHFLPGHPIVITAGAEGQVRFIRWPEMKLLGMVYSPEGQLTSLRVSQNGAFMATGTNEASLVLWDLRVLDIPDLFAQPLATATHDQISTTLALGEYHSLPDPVRNGLKFLRLLLQYRFRYDIQIEEAPVIQFGEFDILLDEQ